MIKQQDIVAVDNRATLIRGDCMSAWPLVSGYQALITDPPYGMRWQSGHRKSGKLAKIRNDESPFIWWLGESYSRAPETCAMLCFCNWSTQEVWRSAIDVAGWDVQSHVIWDRKTHGSGHLKRTFAPAHDVIWFATKGEFAFPNKRPKSIVRASRVAVNSLVHPTEKPVDLMAQLIIAVTKPGDVIFDPFMGSGATGIAAIKNGRRFIGVEMDLEFFDLAHTQISEAAAATELFNAFDYFSVQTDLVDLLQGEA